MHNFLYGEGSEYSKSCNLFSRFLVTNFLISSQATLPCTSFLCLFPPKSSCCRLLSLSKQGFPPQIGSFLEA